MRHLTAELRGKDIELARLLEEKMRIMSDMLVVLGTQDPMRENPPDYMSLVREKENHCTKEELLSAVQVGNNQTTAKFKTDGKGTNA